MMILRTPEQQHDAKGAAIMELALVLPIIVLLVLATVEISRVLKAAQIANELSQEASNSIFRRCSDFLEPDGEISEATKKRTRDCVQAVYDTEFAPLIANLVPTGAPPNSIRIVLSIYRYVSGPAARQFALINNGPSPTNTRFAEAGAGVSSTVPNVSGGGTVQLDAAFMAGNRRVAIAEVFIQVDPLFTSIPILNSALVGGNYYAASVL